MFVQLNRTERGLHHKLAHSAGFSTYSTQKTLEEYPLFNLNERHGFHLA
jgi:hypothetical protein